MERHNRAKLTDAMRQLPGGVCVITAGRQPARTGYTGTAVFSLCVDPERVVIIIGRGSSSYEPIRDHGDFGLNVLRSDQQALADRFSGRGGATGEARYDDAAWRTSPRGVSLLDGALAAIECRVEEIIERHSHALVIGEPTHIEIDPSFDALIYWRARYSAARALPRSPPNRLKPRREQPCRTHSFAIRPNSPTGCPTFLADWSFPRSSSAPTGRSTTIIKLAQIAEKAGFDYALSQIRFTAGYGAENQHESVSFSMRCWTRPRR